MTTPTTQLSGEQTTHQIEALPYVENLDHGEVHLGETQPLHELVCTSGVRSLS